MFFLLGIPALISTVCASTAATVGTVAATSTVGGVLGGIGTATGLGLLAKGALGVAAKGAAKHAALRVAGTCLAGRVAAEVGESLAKNVLCEKVKPLRGSILKVDLVGGQASHTGVYLGQDRIAEVTEVKGRAIVRIVGIDEFVSGSAVRSGLYIYVAAAKENGRYRALAKESIARRAASAVGARGRYGLVSNNCHNFTRYCITGHEDSSPCLSASSVKSAIRDEFGCDYVSWRSTGRGVGDATFA